MDIVIIVCIAAALMVCLKIRRDGIADLFWLKAQLTAALITESVGAFYSHHGWPNLWMYNIYFTVEFGCLLGFALSYLGKDVKVSVVALAGLASAAFQIIETHSRGGYTHFAERTYVIGALVLCCIYTYALFRVAERSDVRLHRLPHLWILLALVIWFGCSIPFNGLQAYVEANDPGMAYRLSFINEALAVTRYGMQAAGCLLLLRAAPIHQ